MDAHVRLLDTVALLEGHPEAGLRRGQVGTVVEELAPGVYEVDFSDDTGRSYATLGVEAASLLVLVHEPA